MKTSKIIWHGTPTDTAPSDLEPRVSFLEAIWLSGAPEIAALYAGTRGTVHGFVLDEGTRLLKATGHDPSQPFNYPDPETWERAKFLLTSWGYVLEEFECLREFNIESGFQPPLGEAGQPSWEGLYSDLCEVMSAGEDLLRELGCDGIMQTERAELALGDRSVVISKATDPAFKALAAQVRLDVKRPLTSIGMLDGSKLVHVCSLPVEQVIRMQVPRKLMPVTTSADLGEWATPPRLEEMTRVPAL